MKEYQIEFQEKYVWLAFNDGWHKLAGHIANICGIGFSIVPIPNEKNDHIELVFSDLISGSKFLGIPINLLEILICDDKGTTFKLYSNKAKYVIDAIQEIGKEEILKKIIKMAQANQDKFGKMPEIENFDFHEYKGV